MALRKSSLLFGMGSGLIVFSLIYYVAYNYNLSKAGVSGSAVIEKNLIDEEEIIKIARNLGMVYLTETPSGTQEVLSEEQIIAQAAKLGMIFQINAIESGGIQVEPQFEEQLTLAESLSPIERNNSEQAQLSQAQPTRNAATAEPDRESRKYVEINIPPGTKAYQVALTLERYKMVDSSVKFISYMVEKNSTKLIRSGIFRIYEGSDYETILNTLKRK